MEIKSFRFGDLIVIGTIIVALIYSVKIFNNGKMLPETVIVFRDDKIIARYPLREDKIFYVNGEIGKVKISIKDETVRVIESTCPHKICVKTGKIKRSNSQIVCAPNHIMVVIKSSKKDNIDAISR